jgi:hypothetical protein
VARGRSKGNFIVHNSAPLFLSSESADVRSFRGLLDLGERKLQSEINSENFDEADNIDSSSAPDLTEFI